MPDHLSEQQIARYCERQVSPEELLRVDDHVSQCPACRARLATSFDMRAGSEGATSSQMAGSRDDSAYPRGSVRLEHVSYEQMEAFIDGKSTHAEHEAVQAHVDACRHCAGELRDMSDFKAELTASRKKQPEAKATWRTALEALRLSPSRIALALVISAAIVLAVVVEKKSLRLAPTQKRLSAETTPSNEASSNLSSPVHATAGLKTLE